MLRRNSVFLFLSLMILIAISNCASHTYNLNNYRVPVSFGNEEVKGENPRFFRIEKKLTWLLFDLIKVENIDLTQTLQYELPRAKKIYYLRIGTQDIKNIQFIIHFMKENGISPKGSYDEHSVIKIKAGYTILILACAGCPGSLIFSRFVSLHRLLLSRLQEESDFYQAD